ncbi:hypothetical protein ACQCP7_25860, partial [Ralstonia pseudosolanacearum]|uniref:hypothetical protein n=1 Tax=Ralstonia pseudosolanacearum TaxID=1310165 RepID=UPI003CE811D4
MEKTTKSTTKKQKRPVAKTTDVVKTSHKQKASTKKNATRAPKNTVAEKPAESLQELTEEIQN